VDFSAYAKGVVRPAYEDLVCAVERGDVDGVVFWKLDRLVRRPAEFERFWAVAEARDAFLASAMEPIDSSMDLGLALVRILVAFASLESATTSARIRAKWRQMAEAGEAPAARPSYGHTSGYRSVVPHQARVIRLMAQRVLAGDSLKSIAARLERQREPNPSGGDRWYTTTISTILRHPRVAGDRRFQGEIIATDCVPAILDRTAWGSVVAELDARSNAPTNRDANLLFSGLLWCGECGKRLTTREWRRLRTYQCPKSTITGCGKVQIAHSPLEKWLCAEMFDRLERRAAHRYAADDKRSIRPVWDTMTLAEQQAVVRTEVSGVVVRHSHREAPRFDAQRVEVRWTVSDAPTTPPRTQVGTRPLTLEEAGAALGGMSATFVRGLVREGNLAAHSIDGTTWISTREVARFLREARLPVRQPQRVPVGRGQGHH
jgi:DNA invertase Pin-like site-specific DNA recombinase